MTAKWVAGRMDSFWAHASDLVLYFDVHFLMLEIILIIWWHYESEQILLVSISTYLTRNSSIYPLLVVGNELSAKLQASHWGSSEKKAAKEHISECVAHLMCDTLRWRNTLKVLLSYRMCCTLTTCVAFLPNVSLTRFGECAIARIHWSQAIFRLLFPNILFPVHPFEALEMVKD